MRKKIKLIISYPFRYKALIVFSIACLSFITILTYLDKSPSAFIKAIFKKISMPSENFDNSDLYSFSESVSHLETVESILSIIEKSDTFLHPDNDKGIDVTEKFLNYTNIVGDFINLSNLITTWDNKYLAYSKNKLFLFQVLGNKIFLRRLEIPGVNKIEFAYVFKSGAILFCDNKNAFYSHDDLITFHKSSIIDIDGKSYLGSEHGNFFSLGIDTRQIIDNKEIRVWGNYTNYGTWEPGISRSEQVQVWYTIDEGKTIKIAYKFGYTSPKLICRHIHAVNFCSWDNSFWVQTGDMNNECHWIQGKYDWEKDTWSWELKASGDHMSFYKSSGFVFYDNYVYWSDDSSDPEKHGIWRTTYTNLISKNIDSNQFEKVLKTDKEIAKLTGNKDGFMIASQYFKSNDNKYKIFTTYNGGLNWHTTNTTYQIINIHLPNAFGQILGNYFINQETFEAIHYWDGGPSIFINSYLTNSGDQDNKNEL